MSIVILLSIPLYMLPQVAQLYGTPAKKGSGVFILLHLASSYYYTTLYVDSGRPTLWYSSEEGIWRAHTTTSSVLILLYHSICGLRSPNSIRYSSEDGRILGESNGRDGEQRSKNEYTTSLRPHTLVPKGRRH